MTRTVQANTKTVAERPPSGANFVTAKEAAKYVSYSSDYIARLAREAKVAAEQRGRQWYVSLESLKHFSLQQQAEQRARQEALRAERLQEYSRTKLQDDRERRATSDWLQVGQAAGVTAIASVCLLLVGALGWFTYQAELSMSSLFSGASTVSERLQAGLPFADWVTKQTGDVTEVDAVPGHQVRITSDGVEVADGTALSEVVSDPVTAEVVSTSTVVLTPVFTAESDSHYVVELRPVTRATTTPSS